MASNTPKNSGSNLVIGVAVALSGAALICTYMANDAFNKMAADTAKLPKLDPDTSVTMTAVQAYCHGGHGGPLAYPVEYKGKLYSLTCPK